MAFRSDSVLAFCQEIWRKQRSSDGTISLDGFRFEIPSRFRHLTRIPVRYASWDRSFVHLVDPRASTVLARLYPLDRARNADGLRRSLETIANPSAAERAVEKQESIAPLLRKLLEDYSATGLPPAGLKWNPFIPDIPDDALWSTAEVEHFCWRVEQQVRDGGC